ncbi:hypothetical protein SD71_10685 [Cohnella kolymensis]|uniref:Transposase n=1 Tax=Cohnella kolymensis TaxID=1590652 RepID=A0ABR5A5C1_9BACL|nr:hypothetical protein [Cohnella kolymensis]KIL35853.1 hypothetical protein SD71_10685 [Cohnella kolymensis]
MDELITQYIPTQWSQVRYMARGYASEVSRAHSFGLTKGHVYIVHHTEQFSFHTHLYLMEFPDAPFNRAMFDDVPDPEDI